MNPQDYYAEHGYVVFERLIPGAKVDAVTDALEEFKRARLPYYSQSIHKWILPEIDAHGFMRESMEDFSRLFLNCGLSRAGDAVLLGREIHDALRTLRPGFANFVQWQNMLFDRSTGTLDHYDSWYLDTLPQGFLTAAWIALEDIDPDCGPFRIYPGSHLHFARNQLNDLPHDEFRRACAEYAASHPPKLALLKKGDVLFWHPSLVHGALDQGNEKLSRKSLTCHYYPLGMARKGDDDAGLAASVTRRLRKSLEHPVRHADHPVYSLHNGYGNLKFNVFGWLSFAWRSLTGAKNVRMDMRRGSYSE